MHQPRRISIAALLLGALTTANALSQNTLIWSDEFDGSTIDPANWEHMIGNGQAYGIPGWGNNELQYYTDRTQNSFVANGKLHIVARQENFGGYGYTSARLRTVGLRDFQYGRFEARIKLPKGQGIWPAFWMLPTNSPYGGWASSGEIDIMEGVNQMTTIHGTIHHGGASPNNVFDGGSTVPQNDPSADFHVYAIEWEADEMRWYFDGVQYYSINSNVWYSENATGNNRAPFDNPFHFLLNVAVGGNWPGPPNGSTNFPQTMEIDWVRVYSIDDQSSFGPPTVIPGRLEAERFDIGGAGVAFFDCDEENQGGEFRLGGVDIETCSEGGFNVSYMCANEWLEYTVDVSQTDIYLLSARVASGAAGGRFRMLVDGVDVSGEVVAPSTGGWQTWTSVYRAMPLQSGAHIIRFQNNNDDGEYNVNYFDIITPNAADLNVNGLVNVADMSILVECLNGAERNPTPACNDPYGRADQDNDADIDMRDLATFQQNYAAS